MAWYYHDSNITRQYAVLQTLIILYDIGLLYIILYYY